MGAGKTSGFQGLLANQQILERWKNFFNIVLGKILKRDRLLIRPIFSPTVHTFVKRQAVKDKFL
jgi:hypothetical protein